MVFVLAHLSDPHLAPLPQPSVGELLSKRGLGYLNWLRARGRIHRRAVLDRLIDDMRRQSPNHIVITGDLTNIALPREIAAARAWLEELAPPDRLTLVPGNHDAYVEGALDAALLSWRDYVTGDPPAGDLPFPSIRRRGPLAIVGVSTAIPTRAFSAAGHVDGRQLVRLADDLVTLSREGLFRVVLIHHPLEVTRKQWNKRLENGGTVRTVLTTAGAELVLHGHMHVPSLTTIAGPKAPINVFAVPSASADPGRGKHPAGYALHRIEDLGPAGFSWAYERRGFTSDGSIGTLETGGATLPKSIA